MKISILTLFPELCDSILSASIIGRARKADLLTVECHNIRDYTADKHNRVDDAPYGGGMGMIMQAQPIYDCYRAVCPDRCHLIYMTPTGKTLTQDRVKELAKMDHIAILCGHYEGVDQRVIDEIVDEEISIGDYVLTGGELPACILADAVGRLQPGVLSAEDCFEIESHHSGLLEYPQYSRPAVWRDREVPAVLLSGDHAKVDLWKQKEALRRTLERRPDLLEKKELNPTEQALLQELSSDSQGKSQA